MNPRSINLYVKALALRKKGKSINSIAKQLGLSKGSVSVWVRDILLSTSQKDTLKAASKNAGQLAFKKAARAKHEKYQQLVLIAEKKGAQDTKRLSKREILMLGLGLYWGEGYKKGSAELGFTNSDPEIIRFFVRWLRECFGIQKESLILRLSVNAIHTKREKEMLSFWAKTTGTSLSQCTKTSFVVVKQKRDYTNRPTHYGTLRIKVRGGSVLRTRILSALKAIK